MFSSKPYINLIIRGDMHDTAFQCDQFVEEFSSNKVYFSSEGALIELCPRIDQDELYIQTSKVLIEILLNTNACCSRCNKEAYVK